jgi:hypothetical protein
VGEGIKSQGKTTKSDLNVGIVVRPLKHCEFRSPTPTWMRSANFLKTSAVPNETFSSSSILSISILRDENEAVDGSDGRPMLCESTRRWDAGDMIKTSVKLVGESE